MQLGNRFSYLRRVYRWFTLTLVQQGFWALFILLGDGPRVTEPAALPWDWWGFRVAGPVLATMMACAYLWLRPADGEQNASSFETARASLRSLFRMSSGSTKDLHPIKVQIMFALLALPVMVTVARLIQGPIDNAVKIIIFGAVEALAFQVINFGVAARSFGGGKQGEQIAVGFFAASWAIRDLILAIVSDNLPSIPLILIGGLVVGGLVGLMSLGVRRWTGLAWPAWSVQFLIVTLIIGFT
jgi:hypothetical protein